MTLTADIDLTARDISDLTTADAVTAFVTRLGYPTDCREELTATAFGLTTDTAGAIRSMELLAEDEEQFFRVVFVQLRSVTAKARNELARPDGSDGLIEALAGQRSINPPAAGSGRGAVSLDIALSGPGFVDLRRARRVQPR